MRDFELDPNGQTLSAFTDYTCKELSDLAEYLESFIFCMEEASNCFDSDDHFQETELFCNLSELANDFKDSISSCVDNLSDLSETYEDDEQDY